MFGQKESGTPLTQELYEQVLNEKTNKIINLKSDQNTYFNNISLHLETLKNLRAELKSIKHKIKINKRALRKERRKLNKVNDELRIEKELVVNLNNTFILEGENYIDLSVFQEPKQKIK